MTLLLLFSTLNWIMPLQTQFPIKASDGLEMTMWVRITVLENREEDFPSKQPSSYIDKLYSRILYDRNLHIFKAVMIFTFLQNTAFLFHLKLEKICEVVSIIVYLAETHKHQHYYVNHTALSIDSEAFHFTDKHQCKDNVIWMDYYRDKYVSYHKASETRCVY